MDSPSSNENKNFTYTDAELKSIQYKNFFFRLRENDCKWMNILFLLFTLVQIIFIQRISFSSIVSIIIVVYCGYTIHLYRKLGDINNDKDRRDERLSLYDRMLLLWRLYKMLILLILIDIGLMYLIRGKEIFDTASSENKYERKYFS